jgi:methyl-accepting chemotaxis protein
MKNLPISVKFLAILGMLAVFTIASVTFAARQIYAIGARAAQVNDTAVLAASDLSEAAGSLEKIRAAMEYILITSSSQGAASAGNAISAEKQDIDTRLAAAAAAVPAQQALLQDLQRRSDALLAKAECQEIAKLAANWSGAATEGNVLDYASACAPGFVLLSHEMEAERDHLNRLAVQQLDGLDVQTSHTVLLTFLSVLCGFAMVALIGYFGMGVWVVKPLAGLRVAMERLARGDFNIALDAARHDEVGTMARAVQVFLDAAREKEQLQIDAAAAARDAEAERERAESSREAAVQALVVETVADGLERLSSGDLLYRLNVKFAPEYEKLRMDFNQAMEILEKTMQGIAGNMQGVRTSAGEITRSSDDLARRTEQQAASLEETAAALAQINGTVAKTA